MMKFELGLEEPDPKRAHRSALTIAGSYIAGGMIPLFPYFFASSVRSGLMVSVVVTLFALFAFGYVKGSFTVKKPIRSAWQTLVVGGWRQGGILSGQTRWAGGLAMMNESNQELLDELARLRRRVIELERALREKESIASDFAERNRVEDELAASRAILEATAESLPFDFWAIGPDVGT